MEHFCNIEKLKRKVVTISRENEDTSDSCDLPGNYLVFTGLPAEHKYTQRMMVRMLRLKIPMFHRSFNMYVSVPDAIDSGVYLGWCNTNQALLFGTYPEGEKVRGIKHKWEFRHLVLQKYTTIKYNRYKKLQYYEQ